MAAADNRTTVKDKNGFGQAEGLTRVALIKALRACAPSLSRLEITNLIDATFQEMSDALVRGEKVKLSSFGEFRVRTARARIGSGPKRGAEAPIKARRVLTFKASPHLLNSLNDNSISTREPEQATERATRPLYSPTRSGSVGDAELIPTNDALQNLSQSTKTNDTPSDTFYSNALSELCCVAPEVVLDLGLASLSRTATMMEEMVKETRADLEKIEAQRIEIDREQEETRTIFKEVIEQMERMK
ncbi:MAG TPA: HU family DNA-binding protein [Methylocystis sp.]|nr:HU family DNA-binding protein [Methylocystis sp.]